MYEKNGQKQPFLGCKGFGLKEILWRRVLDVNDRSLRNIVVGLGPKTNGITQESGFDITPASEIMAILCLSKDVDDLRRRIENILLGYTYDNKPFTVKDLGVAGAITVLLKDAIHPNLVQTTEGTAAFVHGGPFANIAHGCNSILATKMAMTFGDYVITEAGFGADLGAEKFYNIKCRKSVAHLFRRKFLQDSQTFFAFLDDIRSVRGGQFLSLLGLFDFLFDNFVFFCFGQIRSFINGFVFESSQKSG